MPGEFFFGGIVGTIKGFIMALGMFTIIPVPKNHWDDRHLAKVMPSLPLAGLIIGALWFAAAYALRLFAAPHMLSAAAVMFVPFILTGFIHLDGYMDTADAFFSRRGIDEKKRILKDPHTGAFAVIAVVGLALFTFAAVFSVFEGEKNLLQFILVPAVSRCIAGIFMLNSKPIFETGYHVTFKTGTKPRHTFFICAALAACLAAAQFVPCLNLWPLLAAAIAGAAVSAFLIKHFNGMSGDLCGCAITLSELAALVCAALI